MTILLKIQSNATSEYTHIKVNKYRVDYRKNWGNQQRNLVGSILVGLSANIIATSEYLNQQDLQELGSLLNQPYFSVQYYDTLSNTVKTADYTASDVSTDLIRLANKEYTALTFTLTAVDMWVS